jgi:hypothetical protein
MNGRNGAPIVSGVGESFTGVTVSMPTPAPPKAVTPTADVSSKSPDEPSVPSRAVKLTVAVPLKSPSGRKRILTVSARTGSVVAEAAGMSSQVLPSKEY